VRAGIFERTLGNTVELETETFEAGPDAVEALFAGALDATFIGPNPAINAYAQSAGRAIRIVSGATSGGAFLVVRPEITGPADLAGAELATPQLGNTQDVALRAWLSDQGHATDASGGGDVSILPQENAATLDAFTSGQIDGAWVPEPWATRLIQEGGGTVLVDERDLWPDGRYVTTHLVVRTEFLDEHPEAVRGLLYGELEAIEQMREDAGRAQQLVNDEIEALTGKRLAGEVLRGAWPNLEFTVDPISSSLLRSADDAVAAGLLEHVDLAGIYALDLLNEVLADTGLEPVQGL
jgi:NitT/TauT family transport system substrate-binding protein